MKRLFVSLAIALILGIQLFSIGVYCATGTIIDSKTYVPIRGVFEELGFNISYDNALATAIISNEEYTIQVPKDKTYFIVNGKSVKPDNPQKIVGGSLYLPLREVGDSIGAAVSWNGESKLAHISYNGRDSYISCKVQQQTTTVNTIQQSNTENYVLNTNSKKFHSSDCRHAKKISAENKQEYSGTREGILGQGYSPCKTCNP